MEPRDDGRLTVGQYLSDYGLLALCHDSRRHRAARGHVGWPKKAVRLDEGGQRLSDPVPTRNAGGLE